MDFEGFFYNKTDGTLGVVCKAFVDGAELSCSSYEAMVMTYIEGIVYFYTVYASRDSWIKRAYG